MSELSLPMYSIKYYYIVSSCNFEYYYIYNKQKRVIQNRYKTQTHPLDRQPLHQKHRLRCGYLESSLQLALTQSASHLQHNSYFK